MYTTPLRTRRPKLPCRLATAAALTVLPLATLVSNSATAEAAVNLGQVSLTSACDGVGGTFLWHLTVVNDTGLPHTVVAWVNGQQLVNEVLPNAQTLEQAFAQAEGDSTSAAVQIDGVDVAGDKVFPVDCLPDQAPTASIELVCPTNEQPDQDIYVLITISVLGDAAEFQWSDTTGMLNGTVTLHNGTQYISFKTFQGEMLNMWASAGGVNIATLMSTVDCAPPGTDQSGSGGTGSGGVTLPQTGGSPVVPLAALSVLLAGFVLTLLGRRRPA